MCQGGGGDRGVCADMPLGEVSVGKILKRWNKTNMCPSQDAFGQDVDVNVNNCF